MGECIKINNCTNAQENKLYGKKKVFDYKERDEEKRAQYVAELEKINPEDIVYVDESGIDNNEAYPYGWALRGQRLHDTKPGNRAQRLSIIGALAGNKFFAPFVFEGYTDRCVFLIYLEKVLLPTLTGGTIIIIDNASFHKNHAIHALAQQFKCTIKYLPPYSPDLNPIEHYWFKLKNDFRKKLSKYKFNLMKSVNSVFKHMRQVRQA
jgi:transposase